LDREEDGRMERIPLDVFISVWNSSGGCPERTAMWLREREYGKFCPGDIAGYAYRLRCRRIRINPILWPEVLSRGKIAKLRRLAERE
jgi:hypothetical protein